ncbi:MAG: hypothetical protein EOP53_19380 [Sphingobacteriales bacterium]|nr:MAG: hypothetical protein EOP53_19380 [Sphingobacteriales bacterium]
MSIGQILRIVGRPEIIKNFAEIKKNGVIYFCETPEIFRERIAKKGYIKYNTRKDKKGQKIGIPQGTPISAFLSNLYLIEFDKFVFEEVVVKRKGLYRRYSDDIVIVCDDWDVNELEKIILEKIKEFDLVIQESKTQKHFFSNINDNWTVYEFNKATGKLDIGIPLKYLGFEFYGDKTLIKSTSLAKFYRKLKKAVRYRAKSAYMSNKKKLIKDRVGIFKFELYKLYSHLGINNKSKDGKRNYMKYVQTAAEIFGEKSIKRQLSRSWKILSSEIKENDIPIIQNDVEEDHINDLRIALGEGTPKLEQVNEKIIKEFFITPGTEAADIVSD